MEGSFPTVAWEGIFLNTHQSSLEIPADAPLQQDGPSTPLVSCHTTSSSQPNNPRTAPQKAATNLEDLEPNLASSLKPHMPNRLAYQEKLSHLQAAFFNYKFEELAIRGK